MSNLYTPRQRNPWWVVLGAGGAGLFAPAAMVTSTVSVFALSIAADTGWSRTLVTVGFTVGAIGMAIGTVVVSQLVDRFGIRHILIPAFGLYLSSLALLGVAPPNVTMWFVCWFATGFFGGGTTTPLSKAVVSWFDNRRGFAVGLLAAMSGLGVALLPLFCTFLLGIVGWRAGYWVLAAIGLIVTVTSTLTLVRVRGERTVRGRLVTEVREHERTIRLDVPGLTLREAVRTRHFWLIAIGVNVSVFAIIGLQVHLVSFMTDRGFEPAQAALLLSMLGVGSVVGRLLGGFLLDRIHGTLVGAGFMIIPVLALLALNQPLAVAIIAAVFIGLAAGVESDLASFFTTRYLGMRSYGQLYSILFAVSLVMTASGPLVMGIVFDRTGSYAVFIPVLMGIFILSSVLILLLGPYRYPAIAGFDEIAAKDELSAAELLARDAQNETQGPKTDLQRSIV